jgi:hypothetical protein
MPNSHPALTAKDHALLFGYLARAVIEVMGEKEGGNLLRQAIRRYGHQRGRRMAQRAQANGDSLDMFNFLAYGEWRANADENEQSSKSVGPHFETRVTKCIWNTTWEENELLAYGHYYCLEIDAALVRGFNPNLNIEIRSTLSSKMPSCHFIFHQVNMTPERAARLGAKKAELENTAVMPWTYHCAHLLHAIETTLTDTHLGKGDQAKKAGLAAFEAHVGTDVLRGISSLSTTDFDFVPLE